MRFRIPAVLYAAFFLLCSGSEARVESKLSWEFSIGLSCLTDIQWGRVMEDRVYGLALGNLGPSAEFVERDFGFPRAWPELGLAVRFRLSERWSAALQAGLAGREWFPRARFIRGGIQIPENTASLDAESIYDVRVIPVSLLISFRLGSLRGMNWSVFGGVEGYAARIDFRRTLVRDFFNTWDGHRKRGVDKLEIPNARGEGWGAILGLKADRRLASWLDLAAEAGFRYGSIAGISGDGREESRLLDLDDGTDLRLFLMELGDVPVPPDKSLRMTGPVFRIGLRFRFF